MPQQAGPPLRERRPGLLHYRRPGWLAAGHRVGQVQTLDGFLNVPASEKKPFTPIDGRCR